MLKAHLDEEGLLKNPDGEKILHSYTPITVDEKDNECELLIKVYEKGKLT